MITDINIESHGNLALSGLKSGQQIPQRGAPSSSGLPSFSSFPSSPSPSASQSKQRRIDCATLGAVATGSSLGASEAQQRLDKQRASERMMESLRCLVSRDLYANVEKAVSGNCSAAPDRRVLCVMQYMNKIDPCLARRCITRIASTDRAVLETTKKCICNSVIHGKRSLQGSSTNQRTKVPRFTSSQSSVTIDFSLLVEQGALQEFVENLNESTANAQDKRGMTPLMIACKHSNVEVVREVLKRKPDLEQRDNLFGRTALIWAVKNNQMEIAELLLGSGADVNAKTQDGTNPLLFSARQGFVDIARALVGRSADLEVTDKYGFTPIMFAACFGHTEILILLAQKNANLDSKDLRGCTPLMLATRSGRHETALALAEVGCGVNARCDRGCSAIHYAAKNGHTTTLLALFSSASAGEACRKLIHDVCVEGNTPLLLAAEAGRTACVSVLIQYGARLDVRNKFGLNAIQLATLEGHTGTVEEIVKEMPIAL